MLAKVVTIKGVLIHPEEEKREPSLWEKVVNKIYELSQSTSPEEIIEIMQETYKIEKHG